jgi:hypothetical protein
MKRTGTRQARSSSVLQLVFDRQKKEGAFFLMALQALHSSL